MKPGPAKLYDVTRFKAKWLMVSMLLICSSSTRCLDFMTCFLGSRIRHLFFADHDVTLDFLGRDPLGRGGG